MKLPLRTSPKKKTLQAATVRRAREADYTEEPNVKLSSAFVVVLLLHLVAVGGIYAFNALKARQTSSFEEADSAAAAQATPAQAAATDAQATPAATPALTHFYRVRSGDTIAKIALTNNVSTDDIIKMNGNITTDGGIHVGEELTLPGAAPAFAQASPAAATDDAAPRTVALRDSGATYTVTHGDTLVSIAKKLHVGFDDLMRLNKIEDPRKLKIGLKLKVPARHPVTTTT